MNNKKHNHLRLPGFCACILIILAAACAEKPLSFTITYRDADGLRPGQFVVYRGIRIGKVNSVSLDPAGIVNVGVTISNEHRKLVYREAEFVIEKPGGWMEISGRRQVSMKDRGTIHTEMRTGDVVAGTSGMLESVFGKAKVLGEEAIRAAQGLKKELDSAFQSFTKSPQYRDFRRSMDDFLSDAYSRGGKEYEEFRQRRLPELKEKAGQFRDQLEREGGLEQARRFWEDFTQWIESLR